MGPILGTYTEADIIGAVGNANVKRAELDIGEGETTPGTIVFAGTEKELEIFWDDNKTYQKIHAVQISQKRAPWKTKEGIHVGTSLEDLVRINGKSFTFLGFDWDYGGSHSSWKNGAIPDSLRVNFDPKGNIGELSGDREFSTEHSDVAAAQMVVSEIIIFFE